MFRDPGLRWKRGVQFCVSRMRRRLQMNHSFYSVDRTTHSKIVAIALICATAVAGIGIAAHSSRGDGLAQTEPCQRHQRPASPR